MNKLFSEISVNDWDEFEGKTLLIRIYEYDGYKGLYGYDPIDDTMYVLAESITTNQ